MRELGHLERVVRPSVGEFQTFSAARRPVVIEQALSDWPAMTRWSGDELVTHYGDQPVLAEHSWITLRELVGMIQSGVDAFTDFTIQHVPAMIRDLVWLPYVDPLAITFVNLWIGGTRKTSLHYDLAENLHAVVRGKKTFYLFAPDQHMHLYPSAPDPNRRVSLTATQFDFFAPDETRFPLCRDAAYYVAECGPGDLLYLPTRWWHAVQHAGDPTMAINFWWPPPVAEALESDSFFSDRELLARFVGVGTARTVER